jgi:DNA-directed RNA polymerase omega subunit
VVASVRTPWTSAFSAALRVTLRFGSQYVGWSRSARYNRLVSPEQETTMALYPEGDKLDAYGKKFELVNLAARRATQMTRDKAPALVETTDEHPLTIALKEIAEGAVVAVFERIERLPEREEGLEDLDMLAGKQDNIDSLISDLFKDAGKAGGEGDGEPIALGTGEGDDESISLEDLAGIESSDSDEEIEL